MSTWKLLPAVAAALLAMLVSAEAAPMSAAPEALKVQAAQSSEVTQAQYWRRGGYGYGLRPRIWLPSRCALDRIGRGRRRRRHHRRPLLPAAARLLL